MFIIYKSNEIDILFLKIYQIIKKNPLSNPLEKEFFIHENKSLFQYFNLFIANKKGISANFQFYKTSSFLWKIFQSIISKKKINVYKKSIIIWKIMNIIEKKNNFNYVPKINNPLKKFQFSFLMARLFEKYFFFRPKWIELWKTSNHITNLKIDEDWQRTLWIELSESINKTDPSKMYYGNMLDTIITLINSITFSRKNFPARLFFISSFTLHPLYINILKLISKHINIYLLHITPCKKNIFIQKSSNYNHSLIEITKTLENRNNSLMKLWGQYEKFYALHTSSKQIKVINHFQKKLPVTLLHIIQNDILESKKIRYTNKMHVTYSRARSLSSTDDSISINICYHEKHEIQILYKKLLSILKKNPDISPSDIVVISTRIEKYIPFINTIFTSENNHQSIPFFISRKISKKTEIVLSIFNKLFNLPNSRFSNQEIIELLDTPEIAHKFNISETEVEILYHWIEKVNIRWGINEKHQNDLFSVTNKKNTWLYGIEKLLLSYAINKNNKLWNNILSCVSINGTISELIGKIAHFIHTLNKWRKKISRPKTFKSWFPICDGLINDFFQNSVEINTSLIIIKKKWKMMIDHGLLSDYKKKISYKIIKINFIQITNTIHDHIFLPGVINFCHPMSIYYIPYKIICIIGVNHNNFPRQNKKLNFNLLHCYSSIGDPDIRLQDSYLFLQNLSCVQKYFYISCVQYSTDCHSKQYPSIFIDQLSDYITNNFCFTGDEKHCVKDNKKKILHHIYKFHKYDDIYNIYQKNSINYNIKKNILTQNTIQKINYKNLINFWKNPICHYYHNIMKNKMIPQKKEIKIIEPFLVDRSNHFKISNIILNAIIQNQDIRKLSQYYKFSGILPHGSFGAIFWNKQIHDMSNIANIIIPFRIKTTSKKFQLKIKNYYIHGLLSEIQKTGLLRWKPNKINYYDRISLWLEHLIYCVLGGTGESKIIGLKNTMCSFSSLKYDVAYNFLFNYIEGYLKGIKQPLWLIQSGVTWIEEVYDNDHHGVTSNKKQKTKGYYKLLNHWHGDNYKKGEKNDIYIQNIILELKNNDIKKICSTAEKWLLPVLKYKK